MKLLDELYDTLLHTGDFKFSMRLAEKIFCKTSLDESEFLHP